jgi:hypothetical protein
MQSDSVWCMLGNERKSVIIFRDTRFNVLMTVIDQNVSSGLCQYVVLWVDTDVSEQPTVSIFRIKVCRVKNPLVHIYMLTGRNTLRPMGEGETLAPGPGKKEQ